MMNGIKLNMEKLSAEERETLTRLIEKANTNAPQSKVWQPSKGQEYWYIFPDGGVDYSSIYDEDIFNFQQVFKTAEEAEEQANKIKYKWQFERLAIESGELENPWDGKHKHWYCLCGASGTVIIAFCIYNQSGVDYFSSKEALEKAIKIVGEDNVKKYILGVKE